MLDGLILYLALKCARVGISRLRLAAAAAVGGIEAILFPLFSLSAGLALVLKGAGGLLLVLIAVRAERLRPYCIAGVAFFGLTFAFGGLLTAVYSFSGVEYAEGNGYLVERAPVSLIVGAGTVFAILVVRGAKAFYRYRKAQGNILPCVVRAGEREVHWRGYADSGNLLRFRGEPVCVTSSAAVLALFGGNAREQGRISVSTVNGSREAPVFLLDELTIAAGETRFPHKNVYLTVGDVRGEYQLILSTELMEASA